MLVGEPHNRMGKTESVGLETWQHHSQLANPNGVHQLKVA